MVSESGSFVFINVFLKSYKVWGVPDAKLDLAAEFIPLSETVSSLYGPGAYY